MTIYAMGRERVDRVCVLRPKTKTYYARRLLEHGALSAPEFVEITGWPRRTAYKALENLVKAEVAERDGERWRLA